jgi:hypothetical protein
MHSARSYPHCKFYKKGFCHEYLHNKRRMKDMLSFMYKMSHIHKEKSCLICIHIFRCKNSYIFENIHALVLFLLPPPPPPLPRGVGELKFSEYKPTYLQCIYTVYSLTLPPKDTPHFAARRGGSGLRWRQ